MSEFDENRVDSVGSTEANNDMNADNTSQSREASQPYQPVTPSPVRRPVSQPYHPYQSNTPNTPNYGAGYPQYQQYRQSPQMYAPGVYNNAQANAPTQVPAVPPKKSGAQPGSRRKLITGIIIGVVAVAVVSISSIGIYSKFSGIGTSNSKSEHSDFQINEVETPQTDTTITGDETELTPAQVAAKVRPSIVSVITTDNVNYNSGESGEGSGIILDSDGYIVTNSHVIGDSKKYEISVITSDGTTYDAQVIGYDTHSDLAVLKIDAKNLPECELGDSSKLVLGDYVIAIGNPGGVQFAGSITDGIISGIDRIIDTTDTESTSAMRYIQTNAAINPGNSGGALVNMYGQVIGINTSKISADGYEGMGFAIPSNTVKEIVQDLVDYGYVQGRVKLGITCVTISSAYESQGTPAGLMIYSIDSQSSLNGKAQVYDIITHCEGNRITSLSQLQDIIFEKKPGDTVKLTLFRPSTSKNKSSTYDVTITLLEDRGDEEEADSTQSDNGNGNNGSSNNYNDFFGSDNGKNY